MFEIWGSTRENLITYPEKREGYYDSLLSESSLCVTVHLPLTIQNAFIPDCYLLKEMHSQLLALLTPD